jgi:carbamoyl-phosphate synthase small subunit
VIIVNNKKLVLENGMVFEGEGFGANKEKLAEIVFNTSVVGYQEILSDPSYCGQMVCMTYPLIGNYGLTDEDYESKNVFMSGFIVHEYNDIPSNFRFTRTLGEVMEEAGAVGISGVDTREIVRLIRDNGSMKALICDIDKPYEECMKMIHEYQYPKNQVPTVSTKKVWYSRTPNPQYTVVCVDCGVKLNIIRKLNQAGCNVVVVPYNTTKEEILRYKPDGLFLSNGPGDPENVTPVINLVKEMKGVVPILGICLGHQMIGLAYGAKTYKMKFGHRGGNHPVKNLDTDKVEITSQNHSFAIDIKSLEGTGLRLTHINLLDNEAEGMMDDINGVIAVQYHPESAAGPEDSEYIFNRFMDLMKKGGASNAKKNRY